MAKHKHLTLEERITIERMLGEGCPFKAIAAEIGKDCTTVSKEVRSRSVYRKTGCYGRAHNACAIRHGCDVRGLCRPCPPKMRRGGGFCRYCGLCNRTCPGFTKDDCAKLGNPPYVCNGCGTKSCTLEKRIYKAVAAHAEYREIVSGARAGFSMAEEEVRRLDALISPLIMRGQSLNHILANNRDSIMVGESTVYRLVAAGVLTARNIDLPRQVRYRPRKKTKEFKVDRGCRIGRTHDDYLAFVGDNPGMPVVQMDTVAGNAGGKVLLTLHFAGAGFMLAFLRDRNDSQSVIDVIDGLYLGMGPETFIMVMPVLLADNGSEFSNPKALEYDGDGNGRTRVFYCDPSSPFQKGAAERNHEFIRLFIKKGESMDGLTQDDVRLMADHINSLCRKSLGNKCPYDAFAFFHGGDVLETLGCRKIPPNEVTLDKSIWGKGAADGGLS